jgi:hypothetical protein
VNEINHEVTATSCPSAAKNIYAGGLIDASIGCAGEIFFYQKVKNLANFAKSTLIRRIMRRKNRPR